MMVFLDVELLKILRELRAQWQLKLQGDEISNPITRGMIERTIDKVTDFIGDIEDAAKEDVDGL